jgi:uncharacterized SAM-binding protein YcdF (DUF218 family)
MAAAGLGFPRIGGWLDQPPCINQADAIAVLGGNPRRIQTGISLYKQGLAPEIWHTGDVPYPGREISFARSAAQRAMEQGVPPEAIHLLATTSTWEDGQAIAALAKERQVQSILVVTNWSHSRRALCTIKHHLAGTGVVIYYTPSLDSRYGPGNWWHYKSGRAIVLRELGKIGLYWARYGVIPWCCEC